MWDAAVVDLNLRGDPDLVEVIASAKAWYSTLFFAGPPLV